MLRLVGNRITLGLQFLDRAVELVHRRADVRQLDDVGVRLQRQLAKLGQIVRHALRFGEVFREQAKEACGDRNVAGLHIDDGGSGKRADARQKRTSRKPWRLISQWVNDGWMLIAERKNT